MLLLYPPYKYLEKKSLLTRNADPMQVVHLVQEPLNILYSLLLQWRLVLSRQRIYGAVTMETSFFIIHLTCIQPLPQPLFREYLKTFILSSQTAETTFKERVVSSSPFLVGINSGTDFTIKEFSE